MSNWQKHDLPDFPLDKWQEVMRGSEKGKLTGEQRRFLKAFLDRLHSTGASNARFEMRQMSAGALGPDELGLVVSVPISKAPNGHRFGKHLDAQYLRFALSFWDRIDFPWVELKPIRLSAEEKTLEQAGILVRTKLANCINWKVTDVYFEAPESVFLYHEHEEPGAWALGRDFSSEVKVDPETRALLLTLQQCVLVPDVAVPLYDILEFKDRRRPELLRLRHALHDLAESIVQSPDQPMRQRIEIAKLDDAIKDHMKTAREWRVPLRLSDIQVKIDAKAIGAGAAVAISATSAGLEAATALLAGAGAAAIAALSMTFGLNRSEVSKSPYEYVSKFYKELH